MWWAYLFIFVAGLIEDFIGAWRTQTIADKKVLGSFWSGVVYTLVYAAVVSSIVSSVLNKDNGVAIVIAYAIGSGFGNSLLVLLSKKTGKFRRSH